MFTAPVSPRGSAPRHPPPLLPRFVRSCRFSDRNAGDRGCSHGGRLQPHQQGDGHVQQGAAGSPAVGPQEGLHGRSCARAFAAHFARRLRVRLLVREGGKSEVRGQVHERGVSCLAASRCCWWVWVRAVDLVVSLLSFPCLGPVLDEVSVGTILGVLLLVRT